MCNRYIILFEKNKTFFFFVLVLVVFLWFSVKKVRKKQRLFLSWRIFSRICSRKSYRIFKSHPKKKSWGPASTLYKKKKIDKMYSFKLRFIYDLSPSQLQCTKKVQSYFMWILFFSLSSILWSTLSKYLNVHQRSFIINECSFMNH